MKRAKDIKLHFWYRANGLGRPTCLKATDCIQVLFQHGGQFHTSKPFNLIWNDDELAINNKASYQKIVAFMVTRRL